MNTEDIIKDLQNLEDIFDFSNLDENRELFSIRNKKVIGKFKLEIPKNEFINDFVWLKSKMYAFQFKDETEHENKIKGISKSQSRNIEFEEYKKCLDG